MKSKTPTTIAAALFLLILYPCGPTFAQRVGAVPLWQSQSLGTSQAPSSLSGSGSYPAQMPTGMDMGTSGYPQPQPAAPQVGSSAVLPQVSFPTLQSIFSQQPRPQNGSQNQSNQQAPIYTEQRSAFEDYVLTGTPGPLNFDIRQFGYDVFRQPSPTAASADNLPVGPEYVVGPGDEVRVNVWGSIEGQWSAYVNRDGTLSFPKIGTIVVTGQTFEDLRKTLDQETRKYYTDFQMSVSLGQLRTVRVYAAGNFLRPGEYTVSSLSTLVDVLFQSGGPSKNGTMRDIELKRGNKTVAHFDAYDLLLKGSRLHDLRLMPEDIIFVPNIGPLAGIAGNVKRPAIYELKGAARLTDLIVMAGGLRGIAYKGRVQVQRIAENQYITVLEVDLIDVKGHPEKNIALQDGDLVKVFAVAEAKNLVTINGAIFRPGEYGISPGVTTVREIIEKAGGPQYYASAQAELTRLIVTPNGPTTDVVGFDLQQAMSGDPTNNLVLDKNDFVLVRAVPGWKSQQSAQYLDQWQQQVMQGASPPGVYASTAPGASITGSATTPTGPFTAAPSTTPGMVPGWPPAAGPTPYGSSEAVGPSSPWLLHQKVSLGGEVKYPGVYAIRPAEKLSSIIQRAGGFTSDAFAKGAVFTRVRIREQQQKQMDDAINKLQMQLMNTSPISGVASSDAAVSDTKGAAASKASASTAVTQKQDILATLRSLRASGRMVIKMEEPARLAKGSNDMELEDGDTLFIPKKPSGVQVMGEVFSSTAITHVKGMGYKDYINMCGGYTSQADKGRTYILKADGSAVPPKPGFMSWNNGANRWEEHSGEVEAGDTVVVPTNFDLFGWFEYVRGFSEILFHIATSAGIVFLRVL
jgi:protein involved in polysaccharide export with SLBB domain